MLASKPKEYSSAYKWKKYFSDKDTKTERAMNWRFTVAYAGFCTTTKLFILLS